MESKGQAVKEEEEEKEEDEFDLLEASISDLKLFKRQNCIRSSKLTIPDGE